jgi:hypothetical protein
MKDPLPPSARTLAPGPCTGAYSTRKPILTVTWK